MVAVDKRRFGQANDARIDRIQLSPRMILRLIREQLHCDCGINCLGFIVRGAFAGLYFWIGGFDHVHNAEACPRPEPQKRGIQVAQPLKSLECGIHPAIHRDIGRAPIVGAMWHGRGVGRIRGVGH